MALIAGSVGSTAHVGVWTTEGSDGFDRSESMDFVDDDEQQRIEKGLRRKLAEPKFPPIFDLPLAHRVRLHEPVAIAHEGEPRCRSRARLEEVGHGSVVSIVNRRVVECVLPKGHDGPHSTAGQKIPLSGKFGASQWI